MEMMPGDRTAAWEALERGEMLLAAAIIGRQDTVELCVWKRDAARLIELIVEETQTREGIANYPRHGMADRA